MHWGPLPAIPASSGGGVPTSAVWTILGHRQGLWVRELLVGASESQWFSSGAHSGVAQMEGEVLGFGPLTAASMGQRVGQSLHRLGGPPEVATLAGDFEARWARWARGSGWYPWGPALLRLSPDNPGTSCGCQAPGQRDCGLPGQESRNRTSDPWGSGEGSHSRLGLPF